MADCPPRRIARRYGHMLWKICVIEEGNTGIMATITVEEIKKLTFTAAAAGYGYNPIQVDAFIEQVERTIEELTEQNAELMSQLKAAGGDDNGMFPVTATELQISAALITAQRTADTIVDSANQQAEGIVNEANEKGEAIMRAVLSEKKKVLDEIDRLRESRNRFRAEYVDVLNRFKSDSASVFDDMNAGEKDIENEVDTIVGETPEETVFPNIPTID